jgi:hypothetical protein
MKTSQLIAAGILAVAIQSSPLLALCQTVGNGTVFAPSGVVIAPSAGQREFSNMSSFSDRSSTSSSGVGDYATRHYNRGESSGIGGSFIGTASPTSESSPAVIVNVAQRSTTPQFRLPNLNSTFGAPQATPALEMYTPALPTSPKLGTLSNPFQPMTFQRDYSRTQLEDLPSFSTQPSFMQNSQFEQFGRR